MNDAQQEPAQRQQAQPGQPAHDQPAHDQPAHDQPAHDQPAHDQPAQVSAYELLGGEARVRALVDRFYDLMALDERFAGIRALHPATLDGSRDKLFWFLCGWLGGPDHYVERFGHPRLRARHLPFPIASSERDQWLLCMAQAMADTDVPQPLFDRLLQAFHGTADWMRNRAG